jgi:hypothetical protein
MKAAKADVFRVANGSPAAMMDKLLSLMGGVETLFDARDIILIKPNLQWFNQGAPNIGAMHAFITRILEMKNGFQGEVVLIENTHLGPRPGESGGWNTPFSRNSDLPGIANYNQLTELLKKTYGHRFTARHLIDIESGAKRVASPADGPGYVLCEGQGEGPLLALDNGRTGPDRREVLMSYPVFVTDKGTLIDYRWGVWEGGAYTRQPVKFVNFAALNHHSAYCGMTSAIKNYLGVADLSGGPDPAQRGKLVRHYHNFHSFPFNKWARGPVPGMLGAEIGYFLKTVRRPFLNITTAVHCGLADRTTPPVAHTNVIAASTDPVALDFHLAKYVLYPNSRISVHDPENPRSPTRQTLEHCARQGDYCLEEEQVDIRAFDLSKNAFQGDGDLVVLGKTQGGGSLKSRLKYLFFRMKSAG